MLLSNTPSGLYCIFQINIHSFDRAMSFNRKQLTIFSSGEPLVYLNEYQQHGLETDRNLKAGLAGLGLPLLGLFGEVGSLLAALKKKQRDPDSFLGYGAAVTEEFGDSLWYLTNIASRARLDLSVIAQRVFLKFDDWDQAQASEFARFDQIQAKKKFSGPLPPETFERAALNLAAKTGLLLNDYTEGRIDGNRDSLAAGLVNVFRALIEAANAADISLEKAAHANLSKTFDRWPQKESFGNLFDSQFPPGEQLPRRIVMRFTERTVQGKTYVVQQCRGINIGDRLTDNKTEADDYRFHDVFHLAYAAILGWSPVVRSLFKAKRKSNPEVDENQDGARAILIEEGISTWTFNNGLRLNWFENVSGVDYSLLKSIREFVVGYEVDVCPLWQWEKAILEGFKVFRQLRKHRRGQVTADLIQRRITFKKI